LENIMSYGGATNRFGFNTAETNYVPTGPAAAGVWLTPDGSQTNFLVPTAACSVSLPNPALCLDQTRTIINGSTLANAANTITLRQYDSGTTNVSHGGAVLVLPTAFSAGAAPATAVCSSASSVTNANGNVYRSLTVYCTGTTWVVINGDLNPAVA
jgi:hypothetical protein